MKKLIFLTLILGYACTSINKPLSDSDREKIINEVKGVISTVVQTCETPNPDKLKTLYSNSPEFVSMVGGVSAGYEQSLKGMYGYLNSVKSQKATIKNEKYSVLDANTVLYTADSRWEAKLQNDSTVVMDPCGMQFLLKKDSNNEWKILSWTEEY